VVGQGAPRRPSGALLGPSALPAGSLLFYVLLTPMPVDATPGRVRQPVARQDPTSRTAESEDSTHARNAFMKAYPVFMHPRCQNCHPAGDTPLQGDDSHVHDLLRLRRGADGNGVFAMRCSNCHQATNGPGPHTPPGAPQPAEHRRLPAEPRWQLPDPKAPMVFQGRTPGQLCRQLKDPKQNGGLNSDRLVHHVMTDPLVLWGWNPGEGRTTPPLSHEEFTAAVKEWLDRGGACPP
jgi:mono/diheme cytochrome c family protein